MATYVVGDIHGCFRTFETLVRSLEYSPGRDRLWLVGDLVNRGPLSGDVVRWAMDQGESVTAVLGNHDLHAIGVAHGLRRAKANDTFDALLGAPDRDDLLDWLIRRPLLVRDDPWVMVHAGIGPGWTPDQAAGLARDVEARLADPERSRGLLASVYDGSANGAWRDDLDVETKHRWVLRALTRLRTCRADTTPCDAYTGPPAHAPAGCRPWYEQLDESWDGLRILFGHWAALGVHVSDRAIALDGGCVYGGSLTAIRLEDGKLFQQRRIDEVTL